MEAVLTERPDWCDDPEHSNSNGCAERLAASLRTALAQLREAYGADMTEWRWGKAHLALFANPVLSRVPALRDWFEVAIPTSGGYDTLDRGPSTIRDDARPYVQRFGAGLRIITDLAAPNDSMMMITPGQSGNPLARHFADLLRKWRDFDWLVPGRSAAVATLVLAPDQ